MPHEFKQSTENIKKRPQHRKNYQSNVIMLPKNFITPDIGHHDSVHSSLENNLQKAHILSLLNEKEGKIMVY